MKIFFKFIAFLLFIAIALVFLVNISNSISLEAPFFSMKANVGFLILSCALLSSIATIFFILSAGLFIKSDEGKFKKQIENTKLNYEIESDKVKQLEAKIETLEEALKMISKK